MLGTQTFKKSTQIYGPLPTWIDLLSRGGLTEPSDFWLNRAIEMETDFELYHGNNSLKKGPGVMKNLVEELKIKYTDVPEQVLFTFVRIRTFIRLKYLDRKELNDRLKKKERKKKTISSLYNKKKKITST
jgi:hypothetical protein